jgi:16S rRNA (cytosine967-C5)-methyltransferase
VLDACAAPGGKTCHLLERTPGLELLALDRSPARLQRVEENLQRLGLEGRATLQAADALDVDSWWDGNPFDRILLDAPCTATGVIRRHPEIKFLRSPAQLDEAVDLQSRLLDALWPLLGPGGMLLYATCSVLKRENGLQLRAFLNRTGNACESLLEGEWGRPAHPGRQILPGEQEMDGFYYAAVRKTS